MISFRLYDKLTDIDLEEWSKKDYSTYYSDVHKYALFDESISQLYQSYVDNPDQMGSIFDKVIVPVLLSIFPISALLSDIKIPLL
mgnify:CR=1 FL=1